jgi:hypothetical protein
VRITHPGSSRWPSIAAELGDPHAACDCNRTHVQPAPSAQHVEPGTVRPVNVALIMSALCVPVPSAQRSAPTPSADRHVHQQ